MCWDKVHMVLFFFFQYLPDLCTLNLAYNKLESLPKLNQRACLCLTRLILRNNNLSVIVGQFGCTHLVDTDMFAYDIVGCV